MSAKTDVITCASSSSKGIALAMGPNPDCPIVEELMADLGEAKKEEDLGILCWSVQCGERSLVASYTSHREMELMARMQESRYKQKSPRSIVTTFDRVKIAGMHEETMSSVSFRLSTALDPST